ncbi:MAG: glycosyltransferase [Chloroflexi bacterium]|nr:MAG: glycosyltransferase [Chloroflexota bacterium]
MVRTSWIAYVGKISLDKGVHLLIAAMPEIVAQVPSAHLLLIGDGVVRPHMERMVTALDRGDLDGAARAIAASEGVPYPNRYIRYLSEFWASLNLDLYRQRAQQAGLTRRILFVGAQAPPDVAQLLRLADLGVVPSLVKEAFPLVSIEALSSGLLPVAPYTGGLRPILDQITLELGPIGRLARLDPSPERMGLELVERIPFLLDCVADPSQRAWISDRCRRIAERYDWQRVTREIEQVYRGIVERRGSPMVLMNDSPPGADDPKTTPLREGQPLALAMLGGA